MKVIDRQFMKFVIQVAVAYLAAIAVAVFECMILDWETVGAGLLVSVFLIPSIFAFAIFERSRFGGGPTKDTAFLLSLMPFAGSMIVVAVNGGEGEEMARFILLQYLSQAAASYLVLRDLSRRRKGLRLTVSLKKHVRSPSK